MPAGKDSYNNSTQNLFTYACRSWKDCDHNRDVNQIVLIFHLCKPSIYTTILL